MPPHSAAGPRDPFEMVKEQIQGKINQLQQDYTRWSSMRLSNPQKQGLGDRIEREVKDVIITLQQMDKSVDKAALDPVRFGLSPEQLKTRRQWVEDARSHLNSISESVAQAVSDFTSVSMPGNAELHTHVKSNQEQQQMVIVQQDEMLDNISAAASRIGQMGLQMNQELKDQERLLEQVSDDTESLGTRLQAAQKKLENVLKKAGTCGQVVIILILAVCLIVVCTYAFT